MYHGCFDACVCCRFELTDVAICSKSRLYGPTDLGEKGIDTFFSNHVCNKFCGSNWKKPRAPRQWFELTSGTSMLSASLTEKLALKDRGKTKFVLNCDSILEEDGDYDY